MDKGIVDAAGTMASVMVMLISEDSECFVMMGGAKMLNERKIVLAYKQEYCEIGRCKVCVMRGACNVVVEEYRRSRCTSIKVSTLRKIER
jgi:hypothetical protein